ncbi:MAG: hypothetical protein ABIK89_11570, partial [Planctomycetota bacterium]
TSMRYSLFPSVLSVLFSAAIVRGGEDIPLPHDVEPPAEPFTLWTGPPIPDDVERIPFVPGVQHQTIHRAAEEGYKFLHGPSGPPRFPGAAKSKQWSYPYGHEHDGKLYVVYSIGKEDCGLSELPIESLEVDEPHAFRPPIASPPSP